MPNGESKEVLLDFYLVRFPLHAVGSWYSQKPSAPDLDLVYESHLTPLCLQLLCVLFEDFVLRSSSRVMSRAEGNELSSIPLFFPRVN